MRDDGAKYVILKEEEKPLAFYKEHGYFPGQLVDVPLFEDLEKNAPVVTPVG